MASEFEAGDLQMMPLREVPVRSSILGEAARASEPVICQIFVRGTLRGDELELALYRARKRIERRVAHQDFYIVSLSSRLIVYKGMLSSVQLREYFCDLSHPCFTSGLAIVHSRFSTNTLPAWSLAQPFRLLAHNGEINTIRETADGWRPAKVCFPVPIWEMWPTYVLFFSWA